MDRIRLRVDVNIPGRGRFFEKQLHIEFYLVVMTYSIALFL